MQSMKITSLLLLALFAGAAMAQSRDSYYVGDKGSGKGFKDAKVGLLNEYAKLKNAPWTLVSENLTDNTYKITYRFADAKTLEAFQKWQYEQPSFAKLDKFSQKKKGTGKSEDKDKAAGRKLAF